MSDAYEKYVIFAVCILKKTKLRNEQGGVERRVVGFTPEAKRYWISLFNEIEANLGPGGRFQYARDHGSKLAENIARVAALLAYVELGEGEDISLGILEDTARIVFYFSDTYLRCFEVLPEGVQDAMALSEYLQSEREDGKRYVRKNKVRQSGPSRLRNKKSLDSSIDMLTQSGEIVTCLAENGMAILDLYPAYPFDQTQWDDFCYENKVFRRSYI